MRPVTAAHRLASRLVVLATALALAGAAPVPAAAAERDHRVDLLRPGDFVTQYTDVACVGASVQTMLNIMTAGADRTPRAQSRALGLAQEMTNPLYVRLSGGGASALGWAYALERMGGGPYRVRAYATRAAALRAVATAIDATGRPAGLLVWQGAHAWVVGGFRSTADPSAGRPFRVLGLVVADPWWPRPTSSRGPTLPPGTELGPADLARHFVRFQRGPRRTGSVLNGGFVVVLPIDRATIEARAAGML